MARDILVYGHGDKSDEGFKNPEDLEVYIGRTFHDYDGQYRYSQKKRANIIILTQDGLAVGHFEIGSMETPTDSDREAYPPVKQVYLVQKSVRYGIPVHVSDLDIAGYQFGKYITEEQLNDILRLAGETEAFHP